MNRRIAAFMLMLAMGLQGPWLAYAAAPGAAGPGSATVSACPEGTQLPDGTDCSACCKHGSMPAGCIAVCAVPMASPVPLAADLTFFLKDAPPTHFAASVDGRRPVPPIRPPIV